MKSAWVVCRRARRSQIFPAQARPGTRYHLRSRWPEFGVRFSSERLFGEVIVSPGLWRNIHRYSLVFSWSCVKGLVAAWYSLSWTVDFRWSSPQENKLFFLWFRNWQMGIRSSGYSPADWLVVLVGSGWSHDWWSLSICFSSFWSLLHISSRLG
jgi:hypothetical protein